MAVSVEKIKQLRDKTLASVSDCRNALEEASGDLNAAIELIRKRGLEIAAKKSTRAANEGRIEAYVHLGHKIGVLVEVNCETDFVAKNEEFQRFTKDLSLQIAAQDPWYIKKEDVPADAIVDLNEKAKSEYYKTHCLLEQPFIKDPKTTIQDGLTAIVARLGENMVIRRFVRYKLGEEEKRP